MAASVANAEIHDWARCRDPDRIPAWIAESLKVHWDWLGVAEQERRTHYEQKSRQQDRPKKVDMLERI